MKKVQMQSCVWLLVLTLMAPVAGIAQDTGSAPPVFRQEELDQMLAPIALYPDSLLIQVLMASTYPLEVVQAARWVSSNPKLKGENLAIALDKKNWDPSVKSLVNFPSVLSMMNDKLEWTQDLGDAFLGQKDQVMASIQNLRAKALAQGNLNTTKEQVVVVQDKAIVIETANPQVIYVPAYNPAVVYGTWWYPAYPPYYYYPPGYVVPSSSAVYFGVGVAWGVAWGYAYGSVSWASSQVYVNPTQNITTNNTYYINQANINVQKTVNTGTTTAVASGGSGTRSATLTTGAGNTATYTGSTVSNPDGSVTNSGSVTGPAGNTGSRSATTSVDPATGTVNRSVTSPAGQTRTLSGTGDGSGNRSATLTTGAGNTATYTGSTVSNPDGSVTNSGSVTGPAGNTGSRSATTSVDPATGTMNRSVTSPAGQTRTLSGTTGTTGTTGQRSMEQGISEWQHNPSHRKGVAYKDPSVRQQFGQTGTPGADARKNFRGFEQGSLTPSAKQGSEQLRYPSAQTDRSSALQRKEPAASDAIRQDRQTSGQRKSPFDSDSAGGNRQFKGKSMDNVPQERSMTSQSRSSSAIENLNRSGSEVRQQSDRGRASRESIPMQKPSQLFQGGKVNPEGGLPNIGGGGGNLHQMGVGGNRPMIGGGRHQ